MGKIRPMRVMYRDSFFERMVKASANCGKSKRHTVTSRAGGKPFFERGINMSYSSGQYQQMQDEEGKGKRIKIPKRGVL
jgi:hypothetical protein